MEKSLNQSEYARHAGVSAMAVSKAVKLGKIPLDSAGRINPEVADRVWRRRSTPQIGRGTIASHPIPLDPPPGQLVPPARPSDLAPPSKEGSADDYFAHRAERERWAALQAELDYRKSAGELVASQDVATEWVKVALVVKTAVLGLPTQLKQMIPHLNREEMAAIERLCLECCEELACQASLD